MTILTEWFRNMSPSDWAIFGILLIALEVLVPSSWLLWPGIAALLVSAIHWLYPLSWTLQLVTFAALTIAILVIGRRFYNPSHIQTSQPDLNQQLGRHSGKQGYLLTATDGQHSKIKLGDTEWRVEVTNLPQQEWPEGAKVEVIDQRSNTLLVRVIES